MKLGEVFELEGKKYICTFYSNDKQYSYAPYTEPKKEAKKEPVSVKDDEDKDVKISRRGRRGK